MKILKVEKSFELCAEAGWYGYHIYFADGTGEYFIRSLSLLGDLLYMEQLKEPFYRVQGRGFLIKGVKGKDHLRIGIENNDEAVLKEILSKLESL